MTSSDVHGYASVMVVGSVPVSATTDSLSLLPVPSFYCSSPLSQVAATLSPGNHGNEPPLGAAGSAVILVIKALKDGSLLRFVTQFLRSPADQAHPSPN